MRGPRGIRVAFATDMGTLPGMETAGKSVKALFGIMATDGERSSLFWWFVENHDEFAQGCVTQRIRWSVMVEQAAALGLTNRAGAVPTPKIAKQTWQRAKKYVAGSRLKSITPSGDEPHVAPGPRFPMPRLPDARPLFVEGPMQAQTGLSADGESAVASDAACAHFSPAPTTFLDAPPAPASSQPSSLGLVPVAASAATRAGNRPPPTPEQIAHRDAQIAKARARHAVTDRFINIKE